MSKTAKNARPAPLPSSRPPLALHRAEPCAETIEFLREALGLAERGECVGFAGVLMLKRQREFVSQTTGDAGRNPVFTTGMLGVLMRQLQDKVLGG